MDFELSPRVIELRDRVRAFMDEHVYPNEAEALRALDEEVTVDSGLAYPEILVEIRDRARSEGLWNLFMPDEEHGAGPDQLGVRRPLRGDGPEPGDRPDGLQLLRPRHRQHGDPRRARHAGAAGRGGSSRCSTARSAPASR